MELKMLPSLGKESLPTAVTVDDIKALCLNDFAYTGDGMFFFQSGKDFYFFGCDREQKLVVFTTIQRKIISPSL